MSITLPTYTRRETPLLGRSRRVRAIVGEGLRRELRRPITIFCLAVGGLLTALSSIIFLLVASFFAPGGATGLAFFYTPASNLSTLFFTTLMAAGVGAGLIADDVQSMALSLYLSRPITPTDYLTAKTAILAPLVALIAILPTAITAILAGILGFFPYDVALEAFGISVALGLLFTAFFTALSLFFSSITSRRSYAAAAVFATSLGLTIPVEILASSASIGNGSLLYLSPWEDYLAVARAAFGAPAGAIDWAPALAILLGITAVAALVTYARLQRWEVVTG